MIRRFPLFAEYVPLLNTEAVDFIPVSSGFPLKLPYSFTKPATTGGLNGWVKVRDRVKVIYPCRIQPTHATNNNTVVTTDGELVQFSDFVYMDRNVQPAQYGSEIRIFSDKTKKNLVAVRKVKRFFQNQLHTKVWI